MSKLVLAFELSGKICTASLGTDADLVEHDFSVTRGRGLIEATDKLVDIAGASRKNIGALVVGVGPGSYTGLRIACSAATALAMALDIPAIGINSFEAAAFARDLDGPLHILLDAYRNEVYHACFERQGDTLLTHQEAQVVSREDAAAAVGQGQSFLGDSRFAGPGSHLIGNSDTTSSALLRLAFARGLNTDGSGLKPALPATPLYLRPAAFKP